MRLTLPAVLTRLVLPLALLAPAVALVPAADAAEVLQPGVFHETKVGGCTFNFVYDGVGKLKGRVYMGTAAHCAEKVGDEVRDDRGDLVGRIAFYGNPNSTRDDYAFVEIDKAYHSRVIAAVKGYPTYPRGVTTFTETSVGDLIQQSGYGMGFDLTQPTREERQSILTGDDFARHQLLGAVIFGDSGGPLVHIPTGKALGIVSRLCIGVCEEEGPTVQGLLDAAWQKGFTVRLRTV